MPRAPGQPKGPMSAYAYFVQTCREEHKKKHPNETVVFTEFSKKCAERWRTMSEKEKKRFQEMAERDKIRYQNEMRHYTPAKGMGKPGKKPKDPNAPKRAMSAFMWFCNEERPAVKAEHPDYKIGDVAKELGKKWGTFDDNDKRKFEEMAKKDRARYEREMKAYKSGKVVPQAVSRNQQLLDEEDDDDDDDESDE